MSEQSAPPLLQWNENDQPRSARWRSESGLAPPKRVILADDTLSADTAYRLACEGTGSAVARRLPERAATAAALARRIDRPHKQARKAQPNPASAPAAAFHLHRQAQAQRARVLAMLLLPFDADHRHSAAPRARREAGLQRSLGRRPRAVRGLAARIAGRDRRARMAQERRRDSSPGRAHPSALRRVFAAARRICRSGGSGAAARHHACVRYRYRQRRAGGAAGATRRRARGGDRTGAARAVLRAREFRPPGRAPDRSSCSKPICFPPGQAPLVVCNPPWLPARPSSRHRARDLRPRQPHAARLSGRPRARI